MRRREFLSGSLLVCAGVAGCTGTTAEEASAKVPTAAISMDPVTDLEIAERIHRPVRDDGSKRATILAEATTNGSSTVEDIRPPFDDGDRTVYEKTLYRLSYTIEEQQPATVYPIVLNDLAYEGVTTAADAEGIRFADLPAVDKEIFRKNSLDEGETLGIGTNLLYTDAQADRSVLVPDPEYSVIEWGPDRRGKFVIRGEPTDRTLSKYRYTVETVAEPAATYGRELRDQYTIDLSDVPDEEAEILSTAVEREDGYEIPPETTPSPAFLSLADRFRPARNMRTFRDGFQEPPDSDPRHGTYLVRFDDRSYWAAVFISHSLRDLTPTRTNE